MKKVHQLNNMKIINEGFKEKLKKDCKVFLKKEKKQNDNMVANNTKIYQKMKNKSWLNTKTKYHKMKGTLYYNYNKLFSFRKFVFSWTWAS